MKKRSFFIEVRRGLRPPLVSVRPPGRALSAPTEQVGSGRGGDTSSVSPRPAEMQGRPAVEPSDDENVIARDHLPVSTGEVGVIPLLHLAQEQDGWVTEDAMEHIAELVGVTPAEVLGTCSFYEMFKRRTGRPLPRQRLHEHLLSARRR